LHQEKKDLRMFRIMLKEKKGFLNQERKDEKMVRIVLKEKRISEPGKEG